MSKITDQDRHDYERGQNDAKMPGLERNLGDQLRDESGSYWKGREGRDLDDDKKEK